MSPFYCGRTSEHILVPIAYISLHKMTGHKENEKIRRKKLLDKKLESVGCLNPRYKINITEMFQSNEKIEIIEGKEKARKVCETRILTQEDFRRINAYRLKKSITSSGKRRNDDIKLDEELEEKVAR